MNKFSVEYQGTKWDLYNGDHESWKAKNKEDAQDLVDMALRLTFLDRKEFFDYLSLYGKHHNISKSAILISHGNTMRNQWVYIDGQKNYLLQSWINAMDGKYSGLVLCVCNPGRHKPYSCKSALLVPDSDIDFTGGVYAGRSPIFSLLVPEVGEIDLYTINYELNQLRRSKDRSNPELLSKLKSKAEVAKIQ